MVPVAGSSPNELIDRTALQRRLVRAQRQLAPNPLPHPLMKRITDDILDRLSAVLRTFETAVVLSPWPTDLPTSLDQKARVTNAFGVSVLAGQEPLLIDDEALPFGSQKLDLMISILALQSTNDLPGALLQAQRSLRPDGLFIGVVFGGRTLHELRSSLLTAEADISGGASPRVLPFGDVRELGGLMQRAGFALPVVDSDTVCVTYETPLHLLRDLQEYGATNILRDRKRVFTSRQTLMRAMEIYAEQFSQSDGRVVATIDLVSLTGWAPAPDQQKPLKPGSAMARLSDALGTAEHSLRGTQRSD